MATRKANRKENRKSETRKQAGGKRPLSDWNKLVASVYKDLKKMDPTATLRKAMQKASEMKKKKQ